MPEHSRIPPTPLQDGLYWLGQAGFWIDCDGKRILIDPYLSDSLAVKYAGQKFPHQRLMPIPVLIDDLPKPDVVLVTHAHTDHMDPDTLAPLAQRFPDCPFVVPAAVSDMAKQRIGQDANLITVTTDDVLEPVRGVHIQVFPAAHEKRLCDDQGRDHFLGYGIQIQRRRFFHSGDTIPFDALVTRLRTYQPDMALLPVNGRDATRRDNGIPGNLTLTEAIDLCHSLGIPRLIPHHFGMFAFNSIDRAEVLAAAQRTPSPDITCPDVLSPISLSS